MQQTNENTTAPSGTSPNPDLFEDLSKFRVSQDFLNAVSTQRAYTKIHVRKPGKQEFVRTIVDPDHWFTLNLLIVEEDRETYLVEEAIAANLVGEVKPHFLIPTVSRQQTSFLWPIPISSTDAPGHSWHSSSLEAAKLARREWVRIYFKSLAESQYDVLTAVGNFPEPEWPPFTASDYVRLAFRDRVISSMDHPALRRLRGEE